jgi:MRG-binding protein
LNSIDNLAAHPFFREEFSLYNLPHEYDLDGIVSKRRQRDSPSTASPAPEELTLPPSASKPKRSRRKGTLPPPAPTKKEVVTAGLVGGESDSSALTENSEMEVDVDGDTAPPETRSRASITISTPRTPAPEEDEEVEVTSPGRLPYQVAKHLSHPSSL